MRKRNFFNTEWSVILTFVIRNTNHITITVLVSINTSRQILIVCMNPFLSNKQHFLKRLENNILIITICVREIFQFDKVVRSYGQQKFQEQLHITPVLESLFNERPTTLLKRDSNTGAFLLWTAFFKTPLWLLLKFERI